MTYVFILLFLSEFVCFLYFCETGWPCFIFYSGWIIFYSGWFYVFCGFIGKVDWFAFGNRFIRVLLYLFIEAWRHSVYRFSI